MNFLCHLKMAYILNITLKYNLMNLLLLLVLSKLILITNQKLNENNYMSKDKTY